MSSNLPNCPNYLKPPLKYKTKVEKKTKYLRDLFLQGRETSKTSLLAICFVNDFHLPGKNVRKYSLVLGLIQYNLISGTKHKELLTKPFFILFDLIWFCCFIFCRFAFITKALSKFLSIILVASFPILDHVEREMLNYRNQVHKVYE